MQNTDEVAHLRGFTHHRRVICTFMYIGQTTLKNLNYHNESLTWQCNVLAMETVQIFNRPGVAGAVL